MLENREPEQFKEIKTLGAGGFARTCLMKVLDEKHKKEWGGHDKVVFKIPHDRDKEEALIKELINNAIIDNNLRMARSKYVVPYLGFARYGDSFVMVMEYVEGKDLRNFIGTPGKQRPLSHEDALNIAEQVCEGLVAIHRINIFHRDIKPENILISKNDNTAMIMDLGISRILSSTDLASTTIGTIYYMPKELFGKEGGSFYSDIYSLGVTIYEMVTGELPFKGANLQEIIHNILYGTAIPPIKINPDIDEKLNKIILKAMSREIADRYQTAEDMLRAIRAFRRGIDEDDEDIGIGAAKAQELFSSGKVREAENTLAALIKKFPKNPRSYLAIGEFYNGCFRHQEALNTFKKGIQCDPNFALLYRAMALSQIATGAKKQAIENLKKALQLGLESSLEKHSLKLLDTLERNHE